MDKISQSEIEFTKKNLLLKVRSDLRNEDDTRKETITLNINTQSDKSVNIKRGNSEISVNLVYTSSYETLKTLNLIQKNDQVVLKEIQFSENKNDNSLFKSSSIIFTCTKDNYSDFVTIKSNFKEQNPYFKKIESFLKSYSIGCIIEMDVITCDGNIFDMFFNGLKYIFKSISLPIIQNNNMKNILNEQKFSFIDLPDVKTYGILNDLIFCDPTSIEEKSMDGLLHVFSSNTEKSILFEGSCSYNAIKNLI